MPGDRLISTRPLLGLPRNCVILTQNFPMQALGARVRVLRKRLFRLPRLNTQSQAKVRRTLWMHQDRCHMPQPQQPPATRLVATWPQTPM